MLARDVRWEVVDGFRRVPSMSALTVCSVISFVASSQTLTKASRPAPSFLSPANSHRPRRLIGACQKDRQEYHARVRSRVDVGRRLAIVL